MLRRTAILSMMVCVAATASAQLTWPSACYDFGVIKEADGKVSHPFAFVNEGVDTVKIVRTRSSCGCTTVQLREKLVPPGGSGTLVVEFNPSYRPGAFVKHVMVSTDKGTSQLEIRGKVRPEGETVGRLFPEKMGCLRLTSLTAMVGDVKQGHRRMASVTAYNAGGDTLRLALGSSDKRLTAVAENGIVAPGDITSISVTIQAGKDDETGRVEMPVEVADGHRRIGVLTVAAQIVAEHPEKVDYSSAPRLKMDADRVDFTPIGGKKQSRSITVGNEGKGELRITGSGSMSDAVQVKKMPRRLKPGQSGKITIELDPRQMTDDGLLNTSVVVFTNDPLQGTVQIRAVGAADDSNKGK